MQPENNKEYVEINFAQITNNIIKFIGKIFHKLWEFLLYIMHLTIKYWYFSSIAFVFIVFLLIKNLWIEKAYISTFTLRSNAASQQIVMEQINKIGNLIKNSSYQEASRILNISENKIKNIYNLSTYWRIDIDGDSIADYVDYKNKFKRNQKDSLPIRLTDGFVVRVIYNKDFDSKSLNLLQKNIINYITSINYIQEQKKIKLYELNLREQELKTQYKKLDSISKQYYNFMFKDFIPKSLSNQIIFLGGLNNSKSLILKNFLYYKDQLDIYSQFLETVKEKYATQEAVTIVNPPLYREDKIVYSKNYNKYIFYTFLSLLFLLLLIDNWQRIKNFK